MKLIRIIGWFRKEDLDKVIQYANKYNIEKKISFCSIADYFAKGKFNTYRCFYPYWTFHEVEKFSKSEMLYLQEHGFVFENGSNKIVDIETLED